MAHSFDKTYLASLGFADTDRKTPEHDKACQYLAQFHVANELIVKFVGTNEAIAKRMVQINPKFEYALTKGHDQYKSTLGFLDLVIPCEFPMRFDSGEVGACAGRLLIEVKITPIPVSEIIRQINFYREYAFVGSLSKWIAALRFDITLEELQMFDREKINVVRLGAKFDEFLSRADAGTAAKIEEI